MNNKPMQLWEAYLILNCQKGYSKKQIEEAERLVGKDYMNEEAEK